MVAPGADGRRAKGPVVVTAYLLHDAEGVLMERERGREREREVKEKKGEVLVRERRRKERGEITTEI